MKTLTATITVHLFDFDEDLMLPTVEKIVVKTHCDDVITEHPSGITSKHVILGMNLETFKEQVLADFRNQHKFGAVYGLTPEGKGIIIPSPTIASMNITFEETDA